MDIIGQLAQYNSVNLGKEKMFLRDVQFEIFRYIKLGKEGIDNKD